MVVTDRSYFQVVFDSNLEWMEYPYQGRFLPQGWMFPSLLQGKFPSLLPSHPSLPHLKMLMSSSSHQHTRIAAYTHHPG